MCSKKKRSSIFCSKVSLCLIRVTVSFLDHVMIWVSGLGLANFTLVLVFQIWLNLSLSVWSLWYPVRWCTACLLSVVRSERRVCVGLVSSVLPLASQTNRRWSLAQTCKLSCRLFYSYALQSGCLMSSLSLLMTDYTLWYSNKRCFQVVK